MKALIQILILKGFFINFCYQVFKDNDGAVVLVARLLQEGDALVLHRLVVTIEVVRVKKEADPTTCLKIQIRIRINLLTKNYKVGTPINSALLI